jgi:periplasmic divalent cation tolerance protein
MKIKLIYATTADFAEATRIAEIVVTERLAACANILDGATSIFCWEGKLCRENETVIILKTMEEKTGLLIARIKELHSYECPCIVALPIENGNIEFLNWIERGVSST